MNRARYIFRLILLLLIVLQLIYLNGKTDDNVETIAEFKLKTIEKLRTDSLDSRHKVDLLLDETTRFIDNSSHVSEGIHHLMALLALLVLVELGFLIARKRNSPRQEMK